MLGVKKHTKFYKCQKWLRNLHIRLGTHWVRVVIHLQWICHDRKGHIFLKKRCPSCSVLVESFKGVGPEKQFWGVALRCGVLAFQITPKELFLGISPYQWARELSFRAKCGSKMLRLRRAKDWLFGVYVDFSAAGDFFCLSRLVFASEKAISKGKSMILMPKPTNIFACGAQNMETPSCYKSPQNKGCNN